MRPTGDLATARKPLDKGGHSFQTFSSLSLTAFGRELIARVSQIAQSVADRPVY